jgi:hypothetical protein
MRDAAANARWNRLWADEPYEWCRPAAMRARARLTSCLALAGLRQRIDAGIGDVLTRP